jgi:hypothetical protein
MVRVVLIPEGELMKPKHWINLIGVGLAAAALALLTVRWAIASYAEPTCRQFAAANNLTYVSYTLPDMTYQGTSALGHDGDCQFQRADGTDRTVGLYTASGTYGAPLPVSFALRPDIIFIFSLLGVAYILALITRAVTPKKPSQ